MKNKKEVEEMRRKKDIQQMSIDEMIELAKHYEEVRKLRNARRRARRQWLKTAPREETALRYRAEEKPCSIALYLKVERFVLRWLDEFPDLRGDAMQILLTLAHNILHLLHQEQHCAGTTLIDCPAFSLHDQCEAAIEIALNFNLDPKFTLTHAQIFEAVMGLSQGVDKERLHFHTLLGDISIDL